MTPASTVAVPESAHDGRDDGPLPLDQGGGKTPGSRRKFILAKTEEKNMKGLISLVTVAMFAAVGLGADQLLAWPQFRGPGGSGIAEGQKPPVELGPDKNVQWKVPAPSGLSSPIVAGDKLIITAFEGGKLYTIAYRRADGTEAWRREAPVKQIELYHKTEGSPAASTPATDGERIVTYFGSCGLFCYDLSGKELWKFEMPTASIPGNFGSGVSPILMDGMVVLVRDELEGPEILALNAATGSLQVGEEAAVARFVLHAGRVGHSGRQAGCCGRARTDDRLRPEDRRREMVPGGHAVRALRFPVVADGILFFAGWSPGGPDDKDFQMPTFDSLLQQADTNKDGVLSREEAQKTFMKDFFDSFDANQDGKITREEWDVVLKFMAEGKNSAFALKAGGTGDVTSSHLLWKQTKGLPYIPSALVYRGQCLMVKDGGLVTAYDAQTGKEIYLQKRVAAPAVTTPPRSLPTGTSISRRWRTGP